MEKNLSNQFIRWYNNVFRQDSIFTTLLGCTEGSPWHREDNVGIHTDMVVSEYLAITSGNDWTQDDLLGALACAFHDVGKPRASERNGVKFKPERGNYLSFSGHEQISARFWEDYVATNWIELQKTFDLVPFDIFAVGWMIEHHLPWGVKKTDKVKQIAQTAMFIDPTVFTNFLLADTYGRISDDEIEKRQKVGDWVYNLVSEIIPRQVVNDTDPKFGQPRLILPVGVSGAGKSTLQPQFSTHEHYSWDDLRLELYLTDEEKELIGTEVDMSTAYGATFKRSCEDKNFSKKINSRFMELIRAEKDIYVDNTNLSKKRRRFFVQEARRKGYFIQAILLPASIETVLNRQQSRPDKTVPLDAVMNQYMSLQYPSFGEVDDIIVEKGNLPKG